MRPPPSDAGRRMSATFFVSDLHLQASRPDLTDIFLRFLRAEARQADALYVLGDLFESWIGDDDDTALALDVQRALRDLTDAGVPCRFMPGNRDFLVGARFADATGVAILGDEAVVDLHGTPTLLLHGDTLCTDDVAYLKVRAMFHDPAWQAQFLAQPLVARRAFAESARAQSREHTSAMAGDIMDVTPAAVAAQFHKHGVARMIHGHTHRPARHDLVVDDRACERWVLADWREHGEMLVVDGADIRREPLH